MHITSFNNSIPKINSSQSFKKNTPSFKRYSPDEFFHPEQLKRKLIEINRSRFFRHPRKAINNRTDLLWAEITKVKKLSAAHPDVAVDISTQKNYFGDKTYLKVSSALSSKRKSGLPPVAYVVNGKAPERTALEELLPKREFNFFKKLFKQPINNSVDIDLAKSVEKQIDDVQKYSDKPINIGFQLDSRLLKRKSYYDSGVVRRQRINSYV